jgi:SlyX protein
MTDLETLSARIDELEIHLAHQDQAIDDLNKTISAQWREIEDLTRRLGNLGNRLNVVEESAGEPAPAEPPPPHY